MQILHILKVFKESIASYQSDAISVVQVAIAVRMESL